MIRVSIDKVMSHGGGKGFQLVEPDGTVTKLFMVQGVDLIIEQARPGAQKKESIGTYSNPGNMPYASILKFLILNRKPLPPAGGKPHTRSRDHRPYAEDARFAVMQSTRNPFPLRFAGRGDEINTATFAVEGNEPLLEFSHPHGKVRMSIELAQKIAEYIPKMYEGRATEFRFIQAQLRKAVRSGTFEPYEKSVPQKRKAVSKPIVRRPAPKRGTQHTFEFGKPTKKPKLRRRR